MSIRSRQTHEPKPDCTSDRKSASDSSLTRKLLSPNQFQHELAKEISRSNRRQIAREFALLLFPTISQFQNDDVRDALLRQTQKRIRISDSIGWYHDQFAILLPETDEQGALALANVLNRQNPNDAPRLVGADIEIIIYPWDDELISLADELSLPPQESTAPNDTFSNRALFGNPQLSNENHLTGDNFHRRQPNNHAAVRSEPTAILERPLLETAVDDATAAQLKAVWPYSRRASKQVKQIDDDAIRVVELRKTPVLKRAMDIAIAGAGLTLLAPVFAIAATTIKVTSAGPIFFYQKREGKGGQVFEILKFRTMIAEAERMQADMRHQNEQDGPAFKLTRDPRVTWVGTYLRKSCVDELPQLWNVLKGDMSLVGPRPLPVGESYGCKAWHRSRLTVLPGLTCIWQASGRRQEVKFDDWMRMDLEYIKKRTFWFDLRLLIRTAILAVLHRGSV